ncbi:hypothetical protein BK653_28430 [Pseudomonas brassicacearum]|nr:hypothetical protein BK653_28430 [Pseudomonas brassicacearum]
MIQPGSDTAGAGRAGCYRYCIQQVAASAFSSICKASATCSCVVIAMHAAFDDQQTGVTGFIDDPLCQGGIVGDHFDRLHEAQAAHVAGLG